MRPQPLPCASAVDRARAEPIATGPGRIAMPVCKNRTLVAVALAAMFASPGALADEAALKAEIAELRAQLEQLKAQMKELAAQKQAPAGATSTAAAPAPATTAGAAPATAAGGAPAATAAAAPSSQKELAQRVDRLEQTVANQGQAMTET